VDDQRTSHPAGAVASAFAIASDAIAERDRVGLPRLPRAGAMDR
jgi:hypothetical protein